MAEYDFKLDGRLPDGTPVGPDTIPLGLFNEFNASIQQFITAGHASLANDVHVKIDEGSYVFRAKLDPAKIPTLDEDIRRLGLSEGNLQSVAPKRAKALVQLQGTVKATGLELSICKRDSDLPAVRVSRATNFHDETESQWVRVEKSMRGEITDMGGARTSNIHVRTPDETLIVAATQDELRKQKENLLYRDVRIEISAEENIATKKLRNISLVRIVGKIEPYDEVRTNADLKMLAERGAVAWAEVDDVDAWVREQRGDDE